MTKGNFIIVFIVGLLSGFGGGILSSWALKNRVEPVQPQVHESGKVLTAEKFVLVDKDGKIRGSLGMENDGNPVLYFYNSESELRVGLDTHRLFFHDNEKKLRLALVAGSKGSRLLLHGPRNIGLVQLNCGGLDSNLLFSSNDKSRGRIHLISGPHNIALMGLNSTPGLTLGGGTYPQLSISDKDGKIIFSAP